MPYPNLKQSVWLVVLFFLITMAMGLPFGVLSAVLDRSLFESTYVIQFMILAGFVLTIVYAYRRTDRTWSDILLLKPVSWKLFLPLGVCIAGLAIVCSDLGNLLRHLMPVPESAKNLFGSSARKETPYPFTFYAMVVQAPLAKEILFRGVILGGLLAHRTRSRAIVWSAVLFAVTHLDPWRYPPALILGLVFALWVVQTGSLLPAILGHALTNFLIVTATHLKLFGRGDELSTGTLLPWWLHGCGIILALIGLLWFSKLSKGRGGQVETRAGTEHA